MAVKTIAGLLTAVLLAAGLSLAASQPATAAPKYPFSIDTTCNAIVNKAQLFGAVRTTRAVPLQPYGKYGVGIGVQRSFAPGSSRPGGDPTLQKFEALRYTGSFYGGGNVQKSGFKALAPGRYLARMVAQPGRVGSGFQWCVNQIRVEIG